MRLPDFSNQLWYFPGKNCASYLHNFLQTGEGSVFLHVLLSQKISYPAYFYDWSIDGQMSAAHIVDIAIHVGLDCSFIHLTQGTFHNCLSTYRRNTAQYHDVSETIDYTYYLHGKCDESNACLCPILTISWFLLTSFASPGAPIALANQFPTETTCCAIWFMLLTNTPSALEGGYHISILDVNFICMKIHNSLNNI